jgi:hypothetical protein
VGHLQQLASILQTDEVPSRVEIMGGGSGSTRPAPLDFKRTPAAASSSARMTGPSSSSARAVCPLVPG